MRGFSQILVVTLLNLRSIPQRIGSSLAAAICVAIVVAVLVSVLSIAVGFRATLAETGRPDNVIVLRSGNDSELSSGLSLDETRIIADGPGVLRTPTGPVASAELYVMVDLPKRSTGTEANVPLRGVQPAAFAVRSDIEIVAGEMFEPGRSELIAGKAAAGQFSGLDVGNTLRWGENEWRVVGIFASGGTASESELWCDVRVLQPAYRRGNSFQSVYAKLESEDAFTGYKDTLTTDPRLNVVVRRENDYYAGQSEILYGIITGLGVLVSSLMAIGAVFGAINTMYTAVSSRTREIATLRALGFGALPVVVSVLAESMVVALTGGLVGGIFSLLVFNGYQASTLNWQSFSQVVFAFRVTPGLMLTGLALALVLGLLGGLLPAVRAARLPVATALREL